MTTTTTILHTITTQRPKLENAANIILYIGLYIEKQNKLQPHTHTHTCIRILHAYTIITKYLLGEEVAGEYLKGGCQCKLCRRRSKTNFSDVPTTRRTTDSLTSPTPKIHELSSNYDKLGM